LDPACGSGAFLVAAMKTMIAVYSAVIGRIKFLTDQKLTDWLKQVEDERPSLNYFIKKRVITDNLYGVDIMPEAVEIAKLRLFLALVSSAQAVEDLEPLPNVDFNIMAGNSLIGLLRVDETKFDSIKESATARRQRKLRESWGGEQPTQVNLLEPTYMQQSLLQPDKVSRYQQILREKNESIRKYKAHSFLKHDAASEGTDQETRIEIIRRHIEQVNAESQKKLDQLLLEEFQELKIKYEQAQLGPGGKKGKPVKRAVEIIDIERLQPFHWAYHFDEMLNERGGFDAIIANPPWEIFKPQAKEFFAQHSELVTKNNMDIKSFQKEQKKLLKDAEVAEAWLEYQSQFPHVSKYFRSAQQFINQISIVNGRKAGSDTNLYKLFLEQCFNLLHKRGRCGIIIPTGFYTDLGTKQLREMIFSETCLDKLLSFSNERFIFEGVDHRFKFCLLTFEKGSTTESFETCFRIDPREAIRASELESFFANRSARLPISVELVRRLTPDSLSVMEFKSERDIEIAEKMSQFPLLGEEIEGKWNLKLTAEFHMTNDSHLFKQEQGEGRLPLYEGKMIHQFTHQYAEPRYWVDESKRRAAILKKKDDAGQKLDYQSCRLSFRDIASSTNERRVS